MGIDSRQLIVSRLLCELHGRQRLALGPGIPREVLPYLSSDVTWVDLSSPKRKPANVDLVIVEAVEVSQAGDLASTAETYVESLSAPSWVAVGRMAGANGGLRIVRECSHPVQVPGCVSLIVTDLGVIKISDIGFELRELRPGIGSDDIRRIVRASLHVADDISGLQLCI